MGNSLSVVERSKNQKKENSKIDDSRKEEEEKEEEEEEKDEKKRFLIHLHIFVKNLEGKKVKAEEIKKRIETEFNELETKEKENTEDIIIEKLSQIFIDYLEPINIQNKDKIKNLTKLIYEKKKTLPEIKQFLFDILDNINDYNSLKPEDEKKIDNYIICELKKNNKILSQKEQLKKKYKNKNYIIKYSTFTKIVKENNIILEEIAIEYLLFKMKSVIPLDGEFSLDNLNLAIFLEYLDKIEDENNLQENKSIKESQNEGNNDKLGISLANLNSL